MDKLIEYMSPERAMELAAVVMQKSTELLECREAWTIYSAAAMLCSKREAAHIPIPRWMREYAEHGEEH